VPFGYRAAKGNWRDEQSFVIDLQFIGQGERRKWILTFARNSLTIETKSRNGRETAVQSEAAC
jgi:hypothetical protein